MIIALGFWMPTFLTLALMPRITFCITPRWDSGTRIEFTSTPLDPLLGWCSVIGGHGENPLANELVRFLMDQIPGEAGHAGAGLLGL